MVFYSRTGTTRRVAEEIRENLDGDMEELRDKRNRSGAAGYMRSLINALRRTPADLEDIKNDPSIYELVIIGTPIWAGKISTPIRAYITQNQAKFNNVAFFATAGSNSFEGAFAEMKELIGTPLAEMGFRTKEVKNGSYKSKVAEFKKKFE
ncbi:MAG: flavodoxin family protein [Methanobacterium sp.]